MDTSYFYSHTVILVVYSLVNARFGILDQNRNSYCLSNNIANKYLELNDASSPKAISVGKEFLEIKNMKMNIQKSLYKMVLKHFQASCYHS